MMTEFLTRLRFFIFRKKCGELDDELQFHLEQLISAKEAAGLTAPEARRQALIELVVWSVRGSNAQSSAPAGGSTPCCETLRSGLAFRHYLGCVVNCDTGKPVMVDESRLTIADFEKVKI